MEFINPFIPDKDTYQRRIHPVRDYVEQASHYLSRVKNISYEEARSFVKDQVKQKAKVPTITYLSRGENGDRHLYQDSLLVYLDDTLKKKEIMAPTLTTYQPYHEGRSILGVYIEANIAKRSKAKKAMFAAEAAKNDVLALFEDGRQRNFKLSNNAISGAHGSASNPLFNPTAHSTLTSNCRMTSAFGNANNEKLLLGNRHYHNPHVVINNINDIVTHTDYPAFEAVLNKYKLHLPTTQEVLDAIQYSTDLYWVSNAINEKFRQYIDTLHPVEKAAFLYTGDLFHIRKHNPQFMRIFIERMIQKKTKLDHPVDDMVKYVKSFPEDMLGHTHMVCAKEVMGKGKDYEKMRNTPALETVAATVESIAQTILDYADFIKVIMVSDNVPASVSHFPSSIRRSAVTSDTDSTIFTVKDWVLWLNDGVWWGERADSLASSMIFIANQAIVHILARMSINNGIDRSLMYKIAMKNEFYFPVFITTSVNKHYYASISFQEGNVYDKIKREVKGVHLKNSNSPKFITDAAKVMMEDIMDTVMKGEKIVLKDYIKRVADIEKDIYRGIANGESVYFRSGTINQPDSYNSTPERSPYFHYMLWQEVFAPKYGEIELPPVGIIRISTTTTTPTKFKQWLSELSDQALAVRMNEFMLKYGKNKFTSIQLSANAIAANGIPPEILSVIDSRQIVRNLCSIFYLILETIGYTSLNKKGTLLVSDFY